MTTWQRRLAPAAVLFVMSPVLGELVGAALRLSYLGQPLRVPAIVCFYGGGVLLIRESAVRRGLNRWGVVLLGAAFGVIEEGLALQTIFNPLGSDGDPVSGRVLGVNWLWAVVVGSYHVVWSIVVPIALVHLIFPTRAKTVWLGRAPLAGVGVVFAIGAGLFALISFLRSDFRLQAWQVIATVLIAFGLVWAARRCTPPVPRLSGVPAGPVRVFWTAWGAGLAWFFLHLIAFTDGVGPFVWWTLGAVLFAVLIGFTFGRWLRRDWGSQHTLAACFGAVLAAALFGLLLVFLSPEVADRLFQLILVAALPAGFWWLRRRVIRTDRSRARRRHRIPPRG